MDREHVGYVSGNPARVKILNQIAARHDGLTAEQVRKSVRLPAPTVERILAEMAARGLVKPSRGVYTVTELGIRVSGEVQSLQ